MKYSIFLFIFFISHFLTAQNKYDAFSVNGESRLMIGPGINFGAESWLGIANINLFYNYHNGKVDMTLISGASMFYLFFFNYSTMISNEIKYKNLTFDTSFGFAHFPEEDNEAPDPLGPYKQITFTPKIGIKYKGFRFKFGISKQLYYQYDDGPAVYVGYFSKGIPWSFDFTYNRLGPAK